MPTIDNENTETKPFRFVFFIFLCGIVALGYFGYYKFKQIQVAKMQSQKPQMMELEVPVIAVNFESYNSKMELPSIIYASDIAEIRPQVSGILKEIHFQEGAFIKKGKQLYAIEQPTYLASYNKANSNLKTATGNKKRHEALLKAGAISKQSYEAVANSYEMAKGDFEVAKANLEYTKVFAPISGFITKSNFRKGALITQGQMQEMATITTLSPIYAELSIPRKELAKLESDAKLKVELFSDNIKEEGSLDFAEVLVNQGTDSVVLRATFENSSKNLLPGMYAKAVVYLTPKMVMLIPQKATFRKQDGSLNVFIINKENTIETRVIKEESMDGDKWIIKEGLQNGEIILYEGFQKVKDGAKVKPLYPNLEAK